MIAQARTSEEPGLISPRVGAIIERRGGRPVLAASSLLYAAGLAGIGLAPSLPLYLLAWVVLGGGMGTGLYDAVFAALGKLYGKDARAPITNLTLFGGFAPFWIETLIAATHTPLAASYFLMFASGVSLLALFFVRRRFAIR